MAKGSKLGNYRISSSLFNNQNSQIGLHELDDNDKNDNDKNDNR